MNVAPAIELNDSDLMIDPEEIRRKAEDLCGKVLRAWLSGDDSFFPRVIPAQKSLDHDDMPGAIDSVRRLREGSKEIRGFGYTVEWAERKSRVFGQNQFPNRILFETRDDLLRLINRSREFSAFSAAVAKIRAHLPQLESWICSNARRVIEYESEVDGLIQVVQYFLDNPRPSVFARELPVPVDTKFIERNRRVLREWFDIVLPSHTIRSDETHFERRYGMRYVTWLSDAAIWYWGDLDVEGFQILSSLRLLFPHTRSFLMDRTTLLDWRELSTDGTGSTPDPPPYLTDEELDAFHRCRTENLRIEQERIPQNAVHTVLDYINTEDEIP